MHSVARKLLARTSFVVNSSGRYLWMLCGVSDKLWSLANNADKTGTQAVGKLMHFSWQLFSVINYIFFKLTVICVLYSLLGTDQKLFCCKFSSMKNGLFHSNVLIFFSEKSENDNTFGFSFSWRVLMHVFCPSFSFHWKQRGKVD